MQPNRIKKIINYADISPAIMEAIRKKYPMGWINHTIKIPSANGTFFFAITLDTDEISYLIKVPVKIDTKSEKDEDFFDTVLDLKDNDSKDRDDDDDQDKSSDNDSDD